MFTAHHPDNDKEQAVTISPSEIKQGLRPVEVELVNQWLADGKGVAVYENVDLGHPECGHRQYVTFGTPKSQLGETAPERLPDIGDAINWRYMLVGTFRGQSL